MKKDEQDKRIDKIHHSIMGSVDGLMAQQGRLGADGLQAALEKAVADNAAKEYVDEYKKSRAQKGKTW